MITIHCDRCREPMECKGNFAELELIEHFTTMDKDGGYPRKTLHHLCYPCLQVFKALLSNNMKALWRYTSEEDRPNKIPFQT